MLGLIVVAPEFVTAVLGERWRDAEPVIRLLAWVGLLQSLGTLNSAILRARDRTGTALRYAAIALVASLVGFAIGLRVGNRGRRRRLRDLEHARRTAVRLADRACTRNVAVGTRARPARSLPRCRAHGRRRARREGGAPSGRPARRLAIRPLGRARHRALRPPCAWRAPEVLAELKDIRRSHAARVPRVAEAQSA